MPYLLTSGVSSGFEEHLWNQNQTRESDEICKNQLEAGLTPPRGGQTGPFSNKTNIEGWETLRGQFRTRLQQRALLFCIQAYQECGSCPGDRKRMWISSLALSHHKQRDIEGVVKRFAK